MPNETMKSTSTSVSKDAPVSRKFNLFDKLEKIIDAVDTDEMIEFDEKWQDRWRYDPDTPNEGMWVVRDAMAYVVGVLGARKGDDRFRKFANMLKEEDDETIRTVLEFTQDLRDTLEKSMRSADRDVTRKNCGKLLKQLDYYEDTVSKPASLMLSDATAGPDGQSPADGSNRSASKKTLESIAEDVIRSRYGALLDGFSGEHDEAVAYFVDSYVSQILEVAGMLNLKEKGGVINANTIKSRHYKVVNDLYKNRGDTDMLKGVYDTMNSIAEAVEEFGANATDARSKGQYEDFKRQLGFADKVMENSTAFRPFKQPSAQIFDPLPAQTAKQLLEEFTQPRHTDGDDTSVRPDVEQPLAERPPEPPPANPPEPPPANPPEPPPAQTNPLSVFDFYNTVSTEVLRPWLEEYGGPTAFPGSHLMPNTLSELSELASAEYLLQLGLIPNEEVDRRSRELDKYLNDAVELDPNELRITYEVLDSIEEALEESGANATDAESRFQYEQSKKKLDLMKSFIEPLREKLPPAQTAEQPPEPPPEQPPAQTVEQPPEPLPANPPEPPPANPPEPPPEQPPIGNLSGKEFENALQKAVNRVLDPWRDTVKNEKEMRRTAEGENKDEPTTKEAVAEKVIKYVTAAMNASAGMMKHGRKGNTSPEADMARKKFAEIRDTLNREYEKDVVEGVHDALDSISGIVEEFRANALDDTSVKACNHLATRTNIARTRIVDPAYKKKFDSETPEERANRLYSTAIGLGVPEQTLNDALIGLNGFEWDIVFDAIDALNDIHTAGRTHGNGYETGKTARRMQHDETTTQEQTGFLKARKALDKCSELGRDSMKRVLSALNEMHDTLSNDPDAKIRMVADSLQRVLDAMGTHYGHREYEANYNEYLDTLPKVPEDWESSTDEKLQNLKELDDDIRYILYRDGPREGLGRFIPPQVEEPLRFLVEHYMPERSNEMELPMAPEVLWALAEALPWGGVDLEHTVEMLTPLLEDARRYYNVDTHRATPYEVYMSKLVREPERTQRIMARNDFRFERDEYIKRLRMAYGIESKKQRSRALNEILNDMSADIASIRNLGTSANDPLPRNLKGDQVLLQNAKRFKEDLVRLHDAVIDHMNGAPTEPPDWTGFENWDDLLDSNTLDGTKAYVNLAQRDRDARVARHYRNRRKFYPAYEFRDMWNNPYGDPQSIMKWLRKQGIIWGAQPNHLTQSGHSQPLIGPKDFKELNDMVGPNYYNRNRLDSNQPGLYEFSQKALRIACNLAFNLNNKADAEAARQFAQALEIAGRCRKSGGQGGPRRVTERGEAERVGSGNLTYREARDMYRGALRSL